MPEISLPYSAHVGPKRNYGAKGDLPASGGIAFTISYHYFLSVSLFTATGPFGEHSTAVSFANSAFHLPFIWPHHSHRCISLAVVVTGLVIVYKLTLPTFIITVGIGYCDYLGTQPKQSQYPIFVTR